MVEWDGLENRLARYAPRGFESLSLRNNQGSHRFEMVLALSVTSLMSDCRLLRNRK